MYIPQSRNQDPYDTGGNWCVCVCRQNMVGFPPSNGNPGKMVGQFTQVLTEYSAHEVAAPTPLPG